LSAEIVGSRHGVSPYPVTTKTPNGGFGSGITQLF
jgi:hypothetical protein